MVEPSFKMHWAENVNKLNREDGGKLTLFAWQYKGMRGGDPPPNSWAANPDNDGGIYHVTLPEGSKIKIPKSEIEGVKRTLYMIEGAQGTVDGR